MFKKKAPLYLVVILTIVASIGTYFVTSAISAKEVQVKDENYPECNFKVSRLNGYELISPVLFAEETCESPRLSHVRREIEELINSYKNSGSITGASVYLRRLNKGESMSIGSGELYLPGSLLKVPELITFMKMNEKNPGLLNRRIHYKKQMTGEKNAHYVSKSITPGNMYTIRDLLYYMIVYSDNNATMVLNQMMDINVFKKLFTDLGIAEPDMNANNIPLSAQQFSLFMRVIYNASYLNTEDSEYCAQLLSQTDFGKGLKEGIPKSVKVIHKFGEAGDQFTSHFSESGIVYVSEAPYLVTIMTKGKDMKQLPAVVSSISASIYNLVSSL